MYFDPAAPSLVPPHTTEIRGSMATVWQTGACRSEKFRPVRQTGEAVVEKCSLGEHHLTRTAARVSRTAALRAGPSLNVVSRENLVVLLQASGKTMEQCEGECDVETGRLVGADLVVSGEALTVDGSFKLSLIHATKNGRMLSGSVASGTSFDELDGDVPRAVFELLRPVLGADAVLSPVVEKPKAKRTSSSESLFDPQSMCHGELALRGVAYGISGRSVKWDGRSVVSRTFFCVNAAARVEGPLVVAGWLGFIVQGWCIVDANAPAARFHLEGVFHFDGARLPPDRQADFASTAVSDFCAASQAAVLTGEAVQ